MENIVNSIMVIILIMSLGYGLAYKGIFGTESNQLFLKLVLNIALPAAILLRLTENFTKEQVIKSAGWVGLSFSIVICCILLGRVVSLGSFIKRKELFQLAFVFSNTMFIGIPVNVALFGNESLPYLFLYYFATTSFFWTYGVWCVRGGGTVVQGLKNLLTPVTISFFIGMLMVFLGFQLPEFLKGSMRYVGGITTPLTLFIIGTSIQQLGLRSLKPDSEDVIHLIFRFIVAPAVTVLFINIASGFMEIPTLLKKVYLTQSSLPIGSAVAVISGYYNKTPKEASKLVGLSTVLVIVTIPVYAVLAEILF